MVVLDLGCGQNKVTREQLVEQGIVKSEKVQIIGVDIAKVKGVDKVWDLTKFPYPFKPQSIDAVYSSHFIEHLVGSDRVKFMEEIYRILKPKGRVRFIHPYYKSSRAVQDPTHQWPPICEESYLYFNKGWRDANKLDHYKIRADFDFTIFYSFMDNTWALKNEETRNFAIQHYFNVVADMIVDLTRR